MMTILETYSIYYSIYALLISNTFLIGAAALAIVRTNKRAARSGDPCCSNECDVHHSRGDQIEFNQMTEDRLAKLQETVEKLELINGRLQPASEKLPLENAVRMARAGASIDELIRACGLGQGEARLLMRIHAKTAA